jgi:hypothetical protein
MIKNRNVRTPVMEKESAAMEAEDITEVSANDGAVVETKEDRPVRPGHRYDLRGLQIAAVAFAVMALGGFAAYLFRMMDKLAPVEFAYIGLIFAAWALLFAALRNITEYNMHFNRAFYASLPGIMASMIWGIITVFDYSNGGGYHSFITMGAMFAMYICFMTMLYAYTHVLLGCADLAGDFRKTELRQSCQSIWKSCMVIMILALIVIQGAPVFAEMTKYIVTGCAATAMLICHMLMIRKILAVFDLCDGKRKPGRLSDILSSEN